MARITVVKRKLGGRQCEFFYLWPNEPNCTINVCHEERRAHFSIGISECDPEVLRHIAQMVRKAADRLERIRAKYHAHAMDEYFAALA